MTPLDLSNLRPYLIAHGLVGSATRLSARALAGGVSNVVLLVEPEGSVPFVVKQSRVQLRTEAPWFSRLDRIWCETAAMAAIAPLLPPDAVPAVLFEDRDNFAYAMEAVDPRHVVWKEELLSGGVRPEVGRLLADRLSAVHVGTHDDPNVARTFDDREVFSQLRIDPFYRRVAAVHSELASPIRSLIDEMWSIRTCLVHADFSPKNVLVVDPPPDVSGESPADYEPRLTLIDFETAHYGDPAFDLGFFLSHLLLKGVRAGRQWPRFRELMEAFWRRYKAGIARARIAEPSWELTSLERRAVANLGGCALARVDGTSPVGYLPDPGQREFVRRIGRRVLLEPVTRLSDAWAELGSDDFSRGAGA